MKKPFKLPALSKNFSWLDLITLVLALICLGLFSARSLYFQSASGVQAPVAVFKSGNAERKESGARDFLPASPGTRFYNLDVIWVPAGSTARLVLDDSTQVELSEKTLVVLKRPFKGGGIAREKLKTILGKVTLINPLSANETIHAKPEFKEIPDSKNAAQPVKGSLEWSPSPGSGSVYFLREGSTATISFKWRRPLNGYFVLTAAGVRPTFQQIQGKEGIELPLEINHDYAWQLLDDNQKIVAGPFRLSLKPYDQAEVRKLLLKGGNTGKVQVLMESVTEQEGSVH